MGPDKRVQHLPIPASEVGGAAPAWTHAPPLSDPQHFLHPIKSPLPDPPALTRPPSPSPLLSLLTSALSPQPLLVPGSDVPAPYQAWLGLVSCQHWGLASASLQGRLRAGASL